MLVMVSTEIFRFHHGLLQSLNIVCKPNFVCFGVFKLSAFQLDVLAKTGMSLVGSFHDITLNNFFCLDSSVFDSTKALTKFDELRLQVFPGPFCSCSGFGATAECVLLQIHLLLDRDFGFVKVVVL